MVDITPYDISTFSTLEDFLDEEGIREEATAIAIKRVIALELQDAMRAGKITKAKMAEKMQTSRKQLDRVLDPDEHNVTLATLARAARSVGRVLKVELA